jgi:hypothetical protein
VPVKNRACPMTADCHCHALGNAGANHIPNRRASEVVENLPPILACLHAASQDLRMSPMGSPLRWNT